jgi:hypothetical protein
MISWVFVIKTLSLRILFSMVMDVWWFLIGVNAHLSSASRRSHYTTSSKLEQELSAEAATRNSSVHDLAAG